MVGGEGKRLVWIGVDVGGGVLPSPTGGIDMHAKLLPTVVVFCAACHPRSGCKSYAGGGCPIGRLPLGYVPQSIGSHAGAKGPTNTIETVYHGFSKPDSV